MDNSHLLCFFSCPDGRKHCGYNGSYILTEDDIKGAFSTYKPRESKRLKYADRCRGALQYGGHNKARQNAGDFALAGGNEAEKGLVIPEMGKGHRHCVHTEKQKPEADNEKADVCRSFLFREDFNCGAEEDCKGSEGGKIEGNQKACDRCADVCAHHNTDRLRKAHKPRGDKADGHNRCCRGALYYTRDSKSRQHTRKAVFRQHTEGMLKPLTKCLLRVLTHKGDAAKEKSDTAKKIYQIFHCSPH